MCIQYQDKNGRQRDRPLDKLWYFRIAGSVAEKTEKQALEDTKGYISGEKTVFRPDGPAFYPADKRDAENGDNEAEKQCCLEQGLPLLGRIEKEGDIYR